MRHLVRYGFVLAMALVTATMLDAGTINFFTQPYGTQITTQYASQGVTFQTENPNGPPAIGWFGCASGWGCGNGLSNTPTGEYPTPEFLDIIFATGANDVWFTFDNFGNGNGSYYTAYIGGTPGAPVNLDTSDYGSQFGLVNVTGSHITEIQISNNVGCCWEFGVGQVGFDPIPEPVSLALLAGGLLGLCGLARRRRCKQL